jgi:hypothetical protein
MAHKVQIDDIVRDATPQEIATIEASQLAAAHAKQAAAEAAAAKTSAKAKLAALGLTDAEITALLGV